MGFFTGLAYWGKSLLKGIAWPAKALRGDHKIGPAVRWTLHFILLAGILVILGFINQWTGLDRLLRTPWPGLRMVWLPLVFLSLYLAGWFAWWLARLLRAGPNRSEWPDIDAAWTQATAAVERAGIDLQTVPIYLLLGRPSTDIRSFFAATDVPMSVSQVPRDPTAPVHVFANSEAVYVTCTDTSLMGQQAKLLAEYAAEQEATPTSSDVSDLAENEPAAFSDQNLEAIAASKQQESVASLQSAVAMLVEETATPQPQVTAAKPHSASLLEQADVIQRTTSRLQHLCTLIVQDRRPYCPINGLLVLVPFHASDDELTAGQTAVLLERDLTTIRQTLEVRCGVVVLICDLQDSAGGRELLARFPDDQRHRRLGVSFPLLAQCDSHNTPNMIQTGIEWTCGSLLPPIAYRLAPIRGKQASTIAEQLRANTMLYQLLTELRQRQSRITRLLQRSFCPETQSPWMMTGCYLAATGEDTVRGQGFAGGILPQLVQVQNHVSWTPEALEDDRWCHRLAWTGYLGLTTFLLGIIALVITKWL